MTGRGKWEFAGICAVVLVIAGSAAVMLKNSTVEMEEGGESHVVLPVLIGNGDASWENCVNEVAIAYMEEHPEVEVQVCPVVNIDNADYAAGLIVEEALGKFDGIVEMRNAELYVQENKLAALPETLTKQMKQVKEINGEVYSVPRYYSSVGMIYNKKIFEQMQLTEPQTYDELITVCRTLKKNGITPLTVGAGNLWHLKNWCNVLFYNDVLMQEPNWIVLRSNGVVSWMDDEPMQFLTDFKELFDEEYVEENFASTTDAETIEVLVEERAAMVCTGTWMFSQILKTDPEFEIGWFFLPNRETEPAVELNGDWEWAVTASCEENGLYETAVDFLEFYYSSTVYSEVLESMNAFSSVKNESTYNAIPIQEEIAQTIAEKGEIRSTYIGTEQTPEGFSNFFYTEMLKLAKGEQTVYETAEILEEEWSERLAQDQ